MDGLDEAGWPAAASYRDEALVVTDKLGQVLRCTEAAMRMTRTHPGVHLRAGMLVARLPCHQHRLSAFIERCVTDPSPDWLAVPCPRGTLCTLRALPADVAARLSGAPTAVALLLHDPAHCGPTAEQRALAAQAAYGWTGRETDLVRQLLIQHDLGAAAGSIGISQAHARQRLKSIYAKCGVTGRPELVGRLMGMA